MLADALIGAHDGYDRFVLVFDEQTGPLSWAVEVVDGQPVHGASGLELDIDGSAFIEVMFSGLALSMLEPDDACELASIEGLMHWHRLPLELTDRQATHASATRPTHRQPHEVPGESRDSAGAS